MTLHQAESMLHGAPFDATQLFSDESTEFEKAYAVLRRVILRGEAFTSDAWWREARNGEVPTEHRVIGAAIQKAIKEKRIEQTGEFVRTERPEAHGRPIRVFRVLRVD